MIRSRSGALIWIERVLWVAAAAIGSWTLFVVAQNVYYARLPVPDGHPVEARRQLPGESRDDAVGTSGPPLGFDVPGESRAWATRRA